MLAVAVDPVMAVVLVSMMIWDIAPPVTPNQLSIVDGVASVPENPAPIRFMKRYVPPPPPEKTKSLFARELAVRNSVTGLVATTALAPLRCSCAYPATAPKVPLYGKRTRYVLLLPELAPAT